MLKKTVLIAVALAMSWLGLLAGGTQSVLGAVVGRDPVAIVLAVPANRSAELTNQIRRDVARLYSDVRPGDRFVLVNASTQGVVKEIVMPADIGEADRDRDDALLDLFAPINRFLAINDPTAPADDLNIPMTLRAIGLAVLPRFPAKQANVVLIGSMNWENERDATWSFKSHLVLDGFLNQKGGPFGVIGEEHVLDGARVSILFTDKPEAFKTTGSQKHVIAFWGKSIRGRGGRVGSIEPYAPDAYTRLFATAEDPTPYEIDVNAPRAIQVVGYNPTPVIKSGQPLVPRNAKPSGIRPTAKPPQHKSGNRGSRPAPPAGGSDAGG